MSTELVPAATHDKIEMAKALAHSHLLPAQYRGKPENLLWAITYAESIGVHPMTAVTGIHVIEGKPTASAQLIGGLVRRSGHKLRVTFDRATMTAVAQVIRCDDPDFIFESRWDMDRAKAANLTNKSVWKQYPDAMLKARAITEVARDAAPESLYGVIYTPEELGAEVTVDASTGEMAPAAAPAPVLDDPFTVSVISDDQRWVIDDLAEALGLTAEQVDRGCAHVTGVTSVDLLTAEQAQLVIAAMQAKVARVTPAEQARADAAEALADDTVEAEVVEEVAA